MVLSARAQLFRFFLFLLVFSLISGGFAMVAIRSFGGAQSSDTEGKRFTVVLDAGHGGEDGGAVSKSGIFEKDLNLSIAMQIKYLLEAEGVTVIMTRETDILLYDRTVDYHGRKKALDLAARLKIGEETPDCIFVSVHMNAYPQTQYKGLQVWYSQNDPRSRIIAESIQSTVHTELQPENGRAVKAATSSIFLLHRTTRPAVLVECGFLSNPEEAAMLATEAYQARLAGVLTDAILRSMEQI